MIGKTLDGTIISWNRGAERIYGYGADEVFGRPISILIPPDRADELPQILERIRRGERIDHYITKRCRKDGHVIDVSVTISPVHDEAGTVIGASAIARDVSAQQRAAKDALREREEFISVAAHELRSPLTTLYARLQLVERRLARGELDRETAVRDVTLVRQAADRLKALIERLLDISRISSGQLQLERTRVDVAALARSFIPPMAETLGRDIVMQPPEASEGFDASVDTLRLEQVLVNLLDNAAKYSPHDTPIDLELTTTSDAVRIGVRDRGPGIATDQRERIFEPFHRASTKAPGVGLGLHIAKEIVELHGGSLTLETPADGGGRFVVTLPRDSLDPGSDRGRQGEPERARARARESADLIA